MSKIESLKLLEKLYKEDKDEETCKVIDIILRDLANFMTGDELKAFTKFVENEHS